MPNTEKVLAEKRGDELAEELQKLQSQVAQLRERIAIKPDYTRGVGDPRITSWEVDRTLLEQLESRIESIEKSITSVEEGTYGVCINCGKAINPERLAVLHDTKLCIECARKK
ncbi:MAG: TraR/DksA C4-type zinc finger protein [Anaerolineae bacterium]|nr:TraR/DksA C4-type zinc finger protein [Anaerolineae bacterium]